MRHEFNKWWANASVRLFDLPEEMARMIFEAGFDARSAEVNDLRSEVEARALERVAQKINPHDIRGRYTPAQYLMDEADRIRAESSES